MHQNYGFVTLLICAVFVAGVKTLPDECHFMPAFANNTYCKANDSSTDLHRYDVLECLHDFLLIYGKIQDLETAECHLIQILAKLFFDSGPKSIEELNLNKLELEEENLFNKPLAVALHENHQLLYTKGPSRQIFHSQSLCWIRKLSKAWKLIIKLHTNVDKIIECGESKNCCTIVKTLEIICDDFSDVVLKNISFLQGFQNLKKLVITKCRLSLPDEFSEVFRNLTELDSLNLDVNRINYLPPKIFPLKKLKYLYLTRNQLTEINEEFFELSMLRILNLSHNAIRTISEDAFTGCKNLNNLDLSNNRIVVFFRNPENLAQLQKIPIAHFSQIQSLGNLRLSHNYIEYYDFSWFPNDARELHLNGNPLRKISDIHNCSRGLGLKRLYVHDTFVTDLDDLDLPATIQILTVSQNNITSFNPRFFYKLQELKYLDLDVNNVRQVDRFPIPYLDHEVGEIRVESQFKKYECSCPSEVEYPGKCLPHGSIIQDIILAKQYDMEALFYCMYVAKCTSESCVMKSKRTSYECHSENSLSTTSVDCGKLNMTKIPVLEAKNVTELYLDGNNLTYLDLDIILTKDTRIKTLFLNHSNIHEIRISNSSDELQELHLEGNLLKELDDNLMERCCRLEYLFLQNNFLSEFKMKMSNKSMKELNLQRNQIKEFPYGIIHGNNFIENFFLSFNEISDLNKTMCESSFTILYLDNNNINKIEFSKGDNMMLTQLFLNNNNISELHSSSFLCLIKLQLLHLDSNNIIVIKADTFLYLINIKSLHLEENKIHYIDNSAFTSLQKLNELHLQNNFLEDNSFGGPLILRKHSNFKTINFSANKFHSLPNLEGLMGCKVNTIHFSNNFIRKIDSTLLNVLNADIVFLNDNEIEELSRGKISFLPDVKEMHLEGNRIESVKGSDFKNMKRMKKLYLNDNGLRFIEIDAFKEIESIEYLNLHNNRLENPKFWKFGIYKNLKDLRLDNNSFVCDCDYNDEFHSWSKTFVNMNANLSELKCVLHGTEEYEINEYLINHCKTKKIVLVEVLVSLTLALMLALAAMLFYKYRFEVQVTLYSRFPYLFTSRRVDESKKYDVFVAYSGADLEFVANQLCPGLRQYRLCLHDRDFLVGALVTENIVNSVRDSCCTLLILSNSFLKSSWCRFEFHMAHHMTMMDGCQRLVAIVIEDLNEKNIDRNIRLYLKTNTYLRWDDRLFWKKLYFALPPGRDGDDVIPLQEMANS